MSLSLITPVIRPSTRDLLLLRHAPTEALVTKPKFAGSNPASIAQFLTEYLFLGCVPSPCSHDPARTVRRYIARISGY